MRYIEMDASPACVDALLTLIKSQPARSRIDKAGNFSIVAGDTLSVALINVISGLAKERDQMATELNNALETFNSAVKLLKTII